MPRPIDRSVAADRARRAARPPGDAARPGGRVRPACALVALGLCVALGGPVRDAVAAEREMQIPGPAGLLAGSLNLPDGADAAGPLVLILPGSGPTDRDGNSPVGINAGTYRLLAEGLAARDLASLRIDKRGMFGSAAAASDVNAVTVSDYVTDARGWIAAVRDTLDSECVVLLGHSEGALVALLAADDAATAGAAVCGVVLVAAPGRPLGDVLREQLAANEALAPFLAEAKETIAALEAGRRVDGASISPELAPLFRPQVQGFLIELLALDPQALLGALEMPVLIVQGARDMQADRSDAERLAAAAADAELLVLPEANHVLKAVPADDREANIAAYRDPSRPLVDGVVEAIADYVAARAAAR